MSMGEVTREAMLEAIQFLRLAHPGTWTAECDAIRRLIESRKVSREFVEKEIKYLAEHPSQHRLEVVLNRAGVKVKEE